MNRVPEDKKIPNLFETDGNDEIYQRIKNEEELWHVPAKQYWNSLYEKYHSYLDSNFAITFRDNFFERVWELTQISFLESQLKDGAKPIDHRSRKRKCPDFCMEIRGKRYYYEVAARGPGQDSELNKTFEAISEGARDTPVTQYKERLSSALKEKAQDKYFGTTGYCSHMQENSGLIIAISMAGISWHHQPADHIWAAASCVLGISHPKIDIGYGRDGTRTTSKMYYDKEAAFIKTKSTSLIKTDYFCDDEYSHISAVLISNTPLVFFPDIDKYISSISWPECRNDYLLIHNPLAKVELPRNYFSVAEEV